MTTSKREGRHIGPDGPKRGQKQVGEADGILPESEGSRGVNVSNPSVTKKEE